MIPLSRHKKKVWQPGHRAELKMINQFFKLCWYPVVICLITRQLGHNRHHHPPVSWERSGRLQVIKNNGKTSICLFSVTVTSFNDPPSHHFGLIQPSGEIVNQWFKVALKLLIYHGESKDIFKLTSYNSSSRLYFVKIFKIIKASVFRDIII